MLYSGIILGAKLGYCSMKRRGVYLRYIPASLGHIVQHASRASKSLYTEKMSLLPFSVYKLFDFRTLRLSLYRGVA